MKILKADAKIFNVLDCMAIIGMILGTIYGITLAGQQDFTGQTLLVGINGAFWSFCYLAMVVAISYPIVSFLIHLIWCIFTHDSKYHWSVRVVVGMRCQFKEIRPDLAGIGL